MLSGLSFNLFLQILLICNTIKMLKYHKKHDFNSQNNFSSISFLFLRIC